MSAPQEPSQCVGCRAEVAAEALLCAECGARVGESAALAELRGVVYLLSELRGWEAQGLIAAGEAATLRSKYEARREALRAQVVAEAGQAQASASAVPAGAGVGAQPRSVMRALVSRLRGRAGQRNAGAVEKSGPRRSLFEALADPDALRLLLYTGAAILVVGVVVRLRDVLYLKLREPVGQAVLLALGTAVVTAGGWLMTLRTRLKLTGRALTLIGSLLVPVNFWFLSRSGLINGSGREWVVCALCAVLYGLTAGLLRERLYVYLAAVATVATVWALIFRVSPEAYGLYALTLTAWALIFLHLSRVFPVAAKMKAAAAEASAGARAAREDEGEALTGRGSFELWGGPLMRVALVGAGASAVSYMVLRLGSSPSVAGGAFRWWTSAYDAGVAVLLFVAGAYVAGLAARWMETRRGAVLLTTAAVALMWAEFLVLDGARVRGEWQLGLMAVTGVLAAGAGRWLTERVLALAVWRASAAVLTAVFVIASVVALIQHLAPEELAWSWRWSVLVAVGAVLVAGVLSGRRAGAGAVYGAGLGMAAAVVCVAAGLDALRAAALWPEGWPLAAGVVLVALLLGWVVTSAGREQARAGATVKSAAATEQHAAATVTSAAAKITSAGTTETNARATVMSAGATVTGAGAKITSARAIVMGAVARVRGAVLDGAVAVCGVVWVVELALMMEVVAGRAGAVLLLAAAYWIERGARAGRALFVYLASGQGAAAVLALVLAAGVERRWMALVLVLALFPLLFAVGRGARARGVEWAALASGRSAAALAGLVGAAVLWEAAPQLEAGNERLTAPAVTAGALCVVTMAASLFSTAGARVAYFRLGLGAAVAAFVLTVLRAGYEPLVDVEMYTSPVAALLLMVAAWSVRREWDEYATDTGLLLWTGSLLLCGPLLLRALQLRLLLNVAAPWRDAVVVGVSLALLLFGVLNRLRAPVLVGLTTLVLELIVLALTSVRWLQVPLWIYMVTVGTLILIIWGMFENRREQLLLMRRRLHERGAAARETFGRWR